eukprot:gene30615-34553_t
MPMYFTVDAAPHHRLPLYKTVLCVTCALILIVNGFSLFHNLQSLKGANFLLSQSSRVASRHTTSGRWGKSRSCKWVTWPRMVYSGNAAVCAMASAPAPLASTTCGASASTAPSCQVLQLRDKSTRQNNDSSSVGLGPRLNWKLENDDQLNLSAYIQSQRYGYGSGTLTGNRTGSFPQPDYVDRQSAGDNRSTYGNIDINWVTKIAGGKLDAKANIGRASSDGESRSTSYTADRKTVLLREGATSSRFTHSGTTGKYTRTVFDGHALSTGWEVSRQGSEDANRRVEGIIGLAPDRIEEAFNPVVTKAAVYAQDEWNLSKDWSVYLGARWETIETDSSGTGLQTTRLREDAREIIRRAVGGEDSVVIFAGSGCTGAIAKLIGVLGLRIPSALEDAHHLTDHIPPSERPVVFLGPY